jgi:hypothetical protein
MPYRTARLRAGGLNPAFSSHASPTDAHKGLPLRGIQDAPLTADVYDASLFFQGTEMKTTHAPASHWGQHEPERISFTSKCSKCAQVRHQRGYDRGSLQRLLNRGYPVEAYCPACDQYWQVSLKERTALAEAVTVAGRVTRLRH